VIGIDTNVLVRFIVKDDPRQTLAAVRTIHGLSAEEPGWVSLLVLSELGWTLSRVYKLGRTAVAEALGKLLISKDLVLEQREVVHQALLLYQDSKADFADCVISVTANLAGCSRIVTFDEIEARDLGMELLA
jgi:predicted nucleic-acid-binding protein